MKEEFKKFLQKKNITEDQFGEKSALEMGALYNEFYQEQLATKASKDEIPNIEDALKGYLKGDALETVKQQLNEMQEKVNQVLDNTSLRYGLNDAEKYNLRGMVKDNHEEIVSAIKNKQPFSLSFKVAAIHLTNNGTVTNASGVNVPATDNVMYDDDITKIRFPENFLLNVISNRQVENVPAQRIRKEQTTTEGAVAVTAEGAVKPLVQYKFVRTSTDRVKYAGRIEWSEEFEMDFEALFMEIVKLFEEDVIRAWQDGLIAEVISNATAYVSSTLDDTLIAPDNGLAIVATQSQLQALNYIPDTVIMNPADVVATMFQQDADGNLKLSPYINVATGTINGMNLISTNKVAVGTSIVMESRVYDEIHSDFIMRTGQYGDQFIENEYTAIGEVFSILSIAERDLVGVVAVDLATVKAALLDPTP